MRLARRRGRRQATWGSYSWSTSYVFLGPLFVLLTVFFIAPLLRALWISFQDGGSLTISHYHRLLTSPLFREILFRTFRVSAIVTLAALATGYPVGYVLGRTKGTKQFVLVSLVLFPLWTSVLARTFAWSVLFQRTGIINDLLQRFGLIDEPARILYTNTAVSIGIAHVMLPFMILAIYSVFRRMDWDHVRAAYSLGAGGWQTFWRVVWPLSLPGVAAGTTLVFMLSLGFFITPALLGGPRSMMISTAIDTQVSVLLNFNVAFAQAMVLLGMTLALLGALSRFMSVERIFGTGER